MSLETIYLAGVVLAFVSLAGTLFTVKIWSDGAPSTSAAKAEVIPAKRPEVSANDVSEPA